MHRRRLDKNLGRRGPDHHHAFYGLFEGANVCDQLIGQVALVLHQQVIQSGFADVGRTDDGDAVFLAEGLPDLGSGQLDQQFYQIHVRRETG